MLPRRSKQRKVEVSEYILADTALSNAAKEGVKAYLLILMVGVSGEMPPHTMEGLRDDQAFDQW